MSSEGNIELKPAHIYTVSELSRDIKLILESSFPAVWVEGEISNFSAPPSGHLYFTLKDEGALLSAAMFNRVAKELKFKIEDGLKVICFGKISAYGSRGQYQIIVERIEPKGLGALQLALEQLKEKLQKEGLFAEEHKRPLPFLPQRIGIVTSLTGAAIKDILKVLERRFGDVELIIRPTQVEGKAAKEDIAAALEDLNRFNLSLAPNERIEVLIVGRGGGSIEDLWAFNEEIVARAIYHSKIPVISAVGHERDVTIADLVADKRASTPSVAAELVIPKKEELRDRIEMLAQGLDNAFLDIISGLEDKIHNLVAHLKVETEHILELNSSHLSANIKKLLLLNPLTLIKQHKNKIAELSRQLGARVGDFLKLKETEFRITVEKLASLSPLNILSRGYSITFKMPEEALVKDSRTLRIKDIIKTKLYKGSVISEVKELL
ncbi:MAG: exodeoxyribonuclease VII large subunit [Candidatus Omnitrophica bacterium]|nr:exodeoxyribonuclease VII large subunit [Candidatus Omnitrophota bacterium]